VALPKRWGFHPIRRRVATEVSERESSDLNAYNYMRWAPTRSLGMLARYRQTPTEETVAKILANHPFVKTWEEVTTFLLQYHKEYSLLYDNTH
jgi:hypothetical protein